MASSSQADKPKEAKATTPKEDDLQKIMNLGTFQTYIGDPQMKKREFQVGQPVSPSPDGTEPKDGERSRSPSSIQMTVKVVI
ncbi:MAG: hypothetical protein IKG65_15885 [Exiguobacterium sp.]|uniref:hypothetical protein n=1 Tax=unclassified Exiguobacterium TaxID=2644629 RepID=UPI001BE63F4E|nr:MULTISPECIES: hypothetical protein [unclassified Exiguobacterium]MBQ6459290.1 hypothetical protein [Exiguobacterium sp.]MBR3063849.1 hypothetical protein [Exiguobacterium sp.]